MSFDWRSVGDIYSISTPFKVPWNFGSILLATCFDIFVLFPFSRNCTVLCDCCVTMCILSSGVDLRAISFVQGGWMNGTSPLNNSNRSQIDTTDIENACSERSVWYMHSHRVSLYWVLAIAAAQSQTTQSCLFVNKTSEMANPPTKRQICTWKLYKTNNECFHSFNGTNIFIRWQILNVLFNHQTRKHSLFVY